MRRVFAAALAWHLPPASRPQAGVVELPELRVGRPCAVIFGTNVVFGQSRRASHAAACRDAIPGRGIEHGQSAEGGHHHLRIVALVRRVVGGCGTEVGDGVTIPLPRKRFAKRTIQRKGTLALTGTRPVSKKKRLWEQPICSGC